MGLDVRMKLHNPTADQVHQLNEWIRMRKLHDVERPEYNQFLFQEDGHAYFETMWRYWSPGYDRGPWPLIHAIMRKAASMKLDLYYTDDCDITWDRVTDELTTEYWTAYLKMEGE